MTINVLQAALLGLFACLASLPGMGGTTVGNYTLGRPLVGGLVVGLILGDVPTGIIVGAAIQVVYIALVTPGGTVSADVRAVTYIGIPLSILAIHAQGLDPSSTEAASLAAALGAAVGTIGTVLFYGTATLNLVYPWVSHILFSFVPTFIICMAGSSMVQLMKDYMPMDGIAMKTLFTVGSLLPAVGIAILCKQVVNKPLDWLTFAFGFTLAACLHMNLIACAIVAAFFALIKYQIEEAKAARPAIAGAAGAADEEEEEDI